MFWAIVGALLFILGIPLIIALFTQRWFKLTISFIVSIFLALIGYLFLSDDNVKNAWTIMLFVPLVLCIASAIWIAAENHKFSSSRPQENSKKINIDDEINELEDDSCLDDVINGIEDDNYLDDNYSPDEI